MTTVDCVHDVDDDEEDELDVNVNVEDPELEVGWLVESLVGSLLMVGILSSPMVSGGRGVGIGSTSPGAGIRGIPSTPNGNTSSPPLPPPPPPQKNRQPDPNSQAATA